MIPQPRICMPTWREFKKVAFQGGLYEAQDVLAEVDSVDLLRMEPASAFRWKERWQRRLLWRDISRRLIFKNPGLKPVRLKQQYDLFVLVCQNWWDLLYVNAVEGWKDLCRTSVCYIDELWTGLLPSYKYWLHALNQFDHVVVGLSGTAQPLARAISRPCYYVPGAVDTLRFTPYPNLPPRSIDVYSIGRRLDGIHQALLGMARKNGMFYIYDTLQSGDSQALDHKQHRDLFGNVTKRSRLFVVGPAKMGVLEDTHGQLEFGYRYFEGAAAGSVMIGQAPDCESFHTHFGWKESVISIKPDGSDTAAVVSNLLSDADRLNQIGRRNAAQALLRHDWVYRWKEIFQIAGVQPLPEMGARERRLRELAALANPDESILEK